jgi:hypothetical protein
MLVMLDCDYCCCSCSNSYCCSCYLCSRALYAAGWLAKVLGKAFQCTATSV